MQTTEYSIDENFSSRKQVKPFLDCMLLEGSFTDEEIEDEVQNFMFAVSFYTFYVNG